MIIVDRTNPGQSRFDHPAELDSRLRAAVQNFQEKNSSPRHLIGSKFHLGRKVLLLPSSDLDAIFHQGLIEGWKTFHKT